MKHRSAGVPISWGVCELPGWELELAPDRVLSEMAALEQDLALTGTEPPVDGGPALDLRRSIEFLSTSAPSREKVSLP